MWITWKVIVRETCFCEKIHADFTVSWVFQTYFNFLPMQESRNVDNVKSNCSWDKFLWKNSGGLHTFMSLSKLFQLYTHAGITKCGSHERQFFVRHVFAKNFWRTSQFYELLKNISIFALMLESRNVDHVKSDCSWDMFLWKNSCVLHTFTNFSKIFQLCTHARITSCGSHEN